MNLKKNDKVIILAGKDKGKTGEIREVMPSKNKVVVTGINMISKHVKPNQNNKGGIQKMEAPIDASNVAVVCSKCKKHMTPKNKVEQSGAVTRICRKCNEAI
ncbi:50S ribosomal protein L24 [Candidatus Proelusimicrobium excrementi]|uniref:50S ribosomal protein L24 n=1 Tax=Candidatus Proelusimicrobium excrementi TaxID=3416222 RepID=UPI003CC1F1E8|nr:50S ribosomal protein L24 [Elusimicrobiaceae bacterium]